MQIAVVGSGIAGLAAAWLLSRHHEVTLFEAAERLGGHARTIDVTLDSATTPVDTGFLVFNRRTYPHLCALFEHLDVAVAPSDMSFSVSIRDRDLEWAGSSLATVFARPRHLASPRFLGMLGDIVRFNAAARLASSRADIGQTLGEFLERGKFGRAFRDWYLLPMAGAIWSCATNTMLDYPFERFARFCDNHGLLQLTRRPQWYTVRGGARTYVERLARTIGRQRVGQAVQQLVTTDRHVQIRTAAGTDRFDLAVLACHPDQSLRLLDAPTDDEVDVLGAIRYQSNRAVVHTDIELMPKRKQVWAAWNYLSTGPTDATQPVGVSYLINKLQPLPFNTPVIVTLNPPTEPRAETVLDEFSVEHPMFDRAAVAAQRRLERIQGKRRLWYCGAWVGNGFHEDGLRAAVEVANALGVLAPWQTPHAAAGSVLVPAFAPAR